MSQLSMTLKGARPPEVRRRTHHDYYTPRPLVDKLLDTMFEQHLLRPTQTLCDPHAGSGVWLDSFLERGYDHLGIDIDPTAEAFGKHKTKMFRRNFVNPWSCGAQPHWLLGNPPFADAERQVRHALDIATVGVGFLLRLAFLSSQQRLPLFRAHPPTHIWVLSERPSFTGGTTDQYDYAFFIWHFGYYRPPIEWNAWR